MALVASSAAPYALIPTYFALATLPVTVTHYVKQEYIEPVNPVPGAVSTPGSFILSCRVKATPTQC